MNNVRHTVLIAEDDKILTRKLVNKFSRYTDRFEVNTARDGKEAIRIMMKKRISLLVTDLHMPRIDGFQLLAYVSEHHPVIPCFVMTSQDSPATRDRVAGDTIYFFPKPVDPGTMVRAIDRVLTHDLPRGALRGVSVLSFLRMIALEKKTCLFEVALPEGKKGLFYFWQGVLHEAACGDLRGEAAAMAMITTEKAHFSFKYIAPGKAARKIHLDLETLIYEAKRREIGLPPSKRYPLLAG